MQAFGPEVGGARTSASVQFGFYGGFTRTLDGYVQGLASLRTADIAVRLEQVVAEFHAGQTFHFAAVANHPGGDRHAGVRLFGRPVDLDAPDRCRTHLAIIGRRSSRICSSDFSIRLTEKLPASFYLRQPEAGELSRTPGIAARQSLDFPIGRQVATVGAGGYFARQNYGYGRVVDAWAATLDWNLPFGERWALSGELHRGLGLGRYVGRHRNQRRLYRA